MTRIIIECPVDQLAGFLVCVEPEAIEQRIMPGMAVEIKFALPNGQTPQLEIRTSGDGSPCVVAWQPVDGTLDLKVEHAKPWGR